MYAEDELRVAIGRSPALTLPRLALANYLRQAQRLNEALAVLTETIQIAPGFAPAYRSRGELLAELKLFDRALSDHQQAIRLAPLEADPYLGLSQFRIATGNLQGAIECCQHALKLDPQAGGGWELLGRIYCMTGEFEASADCLRKALQIKPDGLTHLHLSLVADQCDPADVRRLRVLLDEPARSGHERAAAGFALGKLLDDAGQFDEAFAAYSAANQLLKNQLTESSNAFDRDQLRRQVDQTIEQFTSTFFLRHARWGDASELPVFVVGMPRSGTSLVEQIAASHSRVFGAGELSYIPVFFNALNGGTEKSIQPARWDRQQIFGIASAHRQMLQAMDSSASRVIDKMPVNLFYLGLIAVLFPNARVIFCNRDARDTCLSCYFQMFAGTQLSFTQNLANCGTQYREQERLTAHWLKALPLKMLTVQYEDLVADLEGQSRRLIEFMGLEWESSCLDFYKTSRAVMTSSAWQVRQPIYRKSVGRWKHYEQHLSPLLDALKCRSRDGIN